MPSQRRPGAVRSEKSRLAILTAAGRQFAELGYDHLTIEGIAAEAGVGKQTIYRWWPSKTALIAECLVEGIIPVPASPPQTGDARADLESWVTSIVEFIPGNESLLRSLVVAGAEDEDVAHHLNEQLGILPVEGDEQSGIPLEVFEALVGVIVVRSLRRGTFDEGFAKRVVELVLPGEM